MILMGCAGPRQGRRRSDLRQPRQDIGGCRSAGSCFKAWRARTRRPVPVEKNDLFGNLAANRDPALIKSKIKEWTDELRLAAHDDVESISKQRYIRGRIARIDPKR